jgi:hypothetical protein
MSDNILKVLNSEEELKFMPLKGAIKLKLSGSYFPYALNEHITLKRIHNKDGLNHYARSYSDMFRIDEFRTEEIDIEYKDGVITIIPKEALQDNSKYALYIDSGLMSISNVHQINGNDANLISSSVNDKDVLIKASSGFLNDANKIFVASVSIDGQLVENSKLITVPSDINIRGVDISFKDGFVPHIGDEISITVTASQILDKDFKLEFGTGTASPLEDKTPKSTSGRIGESDLKEFYNGLNGSGAATTTTADGTTKSSALYRLEVRQPSKALIVFDKEIDKNTTDINSFDVEFMEAFDNYHLSMMGLYELPKYILEFSIIRAGKVLQIELIQNVDPSAPDVIRRWKE